MARKAKEAEEKKYIEVKMEGAEFNYTCRLYPDFQKDTQKCSIIPVSVTLNGVITVKGVKLFRTDKNSWLQWPQYEYNKEHKDYFYIDKELREKDLDPLVVLLETALDD